MELQRKEKKLSERVNSRSEPVRKVVLEAASRIFNQKGFWDSSISEIASEAGIQDPTIYQYFSGKEDLLFSIVEVEMKKFLSFLAEHLEAISGGWNRLRKLIWCHLRYNDVNREYITLVVLECRSNLKFYETRAYKLIRQYAGILKNILENAVKEKRFGSTKNININMVREIIFGLLDYEAITCIVGKEIPDAAPDHEHCIRLVSGMLVMEETTKDKRQRILDSAVKAFSDKGYPDATIAEIAKGAGVADGTVYQYFSNKEDLLLSIPEARFQEHLNQLKGAFNVSGPVRKLRRFIRHHFSLYLADRDFLRVYLILILLNRRFYQSRAYESLQHYIDVLEEIVKEGIEDKSFARDIDVRVFRNMFLGGFTHMLIRWVFLDKGRNMDKIDEINEFADLFIRALTWNREGGVTIPDSEIGIGH